MDFSLPYMTSGYVDYRQIMEEECLEISYILMVSAGVYMGVALCGLVGNGTVLWFLCFHMKQNPFTVYILNLAIADFFLLVLVFLLSLAAFSLVSICSCAYKYLALYNDFEYIVEFLCHFFDLSSMSLLTAISTERCISVLFPIWYRCHRPKHLSGVVSAMLWVFAGFFVSSMYLGLNLAASYETIIAGVAIAIAITLSSIVFISNLTLFLKLRCGSHRRQPGRLYVAILLNVIFFFTLGLPFSIEVFLHLPISRELLPDGSVFLLALLNSSINPVVYFLVGSCRQRRFQRSVKIAFRRVFEEKLLNEENNVPGGTVVVENAL
ncbi:mas-related G-protein coupled receptor member D-like [Phaenicophaeus curvirostris]|uniref:mas-related G-protein coupled receptor member D-like n=1 Tax=Phaenicophaeus curvirostris TaxID=33595 RepID=UPI0037F0C637